MPAQPVSQGRRISLNCFSSLGADEYRLLPEMPDSKSPRLERLQVSLPAARAWPPHDKGMYSLTTITPETSSRMAL